MGTEFRKLHWTIAAAAGLGLIVGASLLFRVPVSTAPAGSRNIPVPLQLARPTGGDAVLKDEALMRDLRPLFLPTDFNARLPEPKREPGRSILDDERIALDFAEPDAGFARDLPPVALLNGRPADQARGVDMLANSSSEVGLVGLGRGNQPLRPMSTRGGFVEVVAVATGRLVLAQALPDSMAPTGGKAWEPMELFAAVDASGLSAPLVVTDGSGADEVDVHFKKTLAQSFRIGDRLSPGFYRVVVGP
jgi:hypothetical protein